MPFIQVGAVAALMLSFMSGAVDADRLYGRVLTKDGTIYEGYLRWDRNEASRSDFLDGMKELPAEFLRDAERLDPELAARQRLERSIVAFGVRLTWEEDDEAGPTGVPSAIRFAHIASIVPVDDRVGVIHLRDGGEVRMRSSSSDLGRSMRGVVVEREGRGSETVRWRDLERVDFLPAPPDIDPPVARRLYGTVTTEGEASLSGWITWDLDEALTSDILDGRENGKDYEVPFGDIQEIAWESERSARVLLETGSELTLRGTNDVDRRNRGIEIVQPAGRRSIVSWNDFGSVRFAAPPDDTLASLPLPGAALQGTAYAIDGRAITGDIRWGADETQAWEVLDGWSGDVAMGIEFGAIRMISKNGPDGVVVTLRDGGTIELSGDEDVDSRNRGIFVQPEGRPIRLVRWRDLDRVEFVDAAR
jgi:hypothetical protein